MIKRTLGAFFVVIFFILTFFLPTKYSEIMFWVLSLGALYEILKIFSFSLYDFLFLAVSDFFLFEFKISPFFFIYTVFFYFALKTVLKDEITDKFALKTFFIVFYAVFPVFYAFKLFLADKTVVISLILGIWLYDTFAYLFGIKFGKHKMSPKISPKKSYEGLFGATLLVILIFSFQKYVSFKYGIFIVILAPVGDLILSVLKRNYGIKDFSNLIPGHGGILDRIDSFTFLFPVVYLLKGVF
jgi:phosphatidate cytidylyltransferase